MFPRRFFAGRFFAPRYYPQSQGVVVEAPPDTGGGRQPLFPWQRVATRPMQRYELMRDDEEIIIL